MIDLTGVIDPREALKAVAAAAAEWPTPERIGSDLPPVPQMDVEALLPAPLAGYVWMPRAGRWHRLSSSLSVCWSVSAL